MKVRRTGQRVEVFTGSAWVAIGCGANCPRCAGGHPGTLASGEAMVVAAQAGRLNPEKMGCEVTSAQARLLIDMAKERNK